MAPAIPRRFLLSQTLLLSAPWWLPEAATDH